MKFDDKEVNEMIQIIKKNIGSSTIEKIGDTEMKYD